ncbi:hypothetical protein CTZ27_18265 [Streptomyces griseocarneus]|nr:hypothetical protein CTZ27_18265 [Streptomyces griseocarneus]
MALTPEDMAQILALMQQMQQHQNVPNGHVEKENVILQAKTVRGNIIGMAQGELGASLTNADGAGIKAQRISFAVASTNQEFGSAITDSNGEATLDSGANITDPQLMITAATTGYVAVYHGNEHYNPAKAKGKFIVAL